MLGIGLCPGGRGLDLEGCVIGLGLVSQVLDFSLVDLVNLLLTIVIVILIKPIR